MEKESWSSHVLHTGAHTASGAKTTHYICHRSGYFASKSTGKRNMKSSGSKKIDGFCPAEMIVKVSTDTGLVKVRHHKTHFGHDAEYRHVFLTLNERKEIADKLAEGVNLNRILDDVRDNVSTDNFQRLHLLQKKDLYNICREFAVSSKEKCHENDYVSVKLWVERMIDVEDSPIVLHKPQGVEDPSGQLKLEDFMLVIMTKFQKEMLLRFGKEKICIDSTHGTNAYDFLLTTLLVVDEFGTGFPVAFCFSNKTDGVAMTKFFTSIKMNASVIQSKVFMSDDAPSFYNSWKLVMGESEHQLLCLWHVDRNLRKNLSKIKNTVKKAAVYKTLRVIIQEIDRKTFEKLLENALESFIEDPDTHMFGIYFRDHYANRPELWAFCFRVHLGINTNMYLEALHKTVKYIYLDGKKVKRLDQTIFALLRFVRDLVFARLHKIIKKKPSKKIDEIRGSHEKSKLISLSAIISTGVDCEAWDVSSTKSNVYHVEKIREPICVMQCKFICVECNICIHMYQCTCVENVIKYNLCKHIHACHMSHGHGNQDVTPSETNIVDATKSILQFLPPINSQVSSKSNDKLDTILKKFDLARASTLNSKGNAELLTEIESHLDKILLAHSKASPSNYVPLPSTSKEPANKKLAVQRFVSTKRKRPSTEMTLSKPLPHETQNIIDGLMHPGEEIIHVHVDFDHKY